MSETDKNYQEYCEGCKQQGVDPQTEVAWEKQCKLALAQIKAESSTLPELIEIARQTWPQYAESIIEGSSDREIAQEIIKSLKRDRDEESHEG